MSYGMQRNAPGIYADADIYSNVGGANPHRLIELLLEGAMSRITLARSYILSNRIADKCERISQAIRIVEGLRLGLDREKGQAIAANLEQLYDYISRQLLIANVNNDETILAEVNGLLQQIHAGWVAVREQAGTIPAEPVKARLYATTI
jgi:flagellar protein FliS